MTKRSDLRENCNNNLCIYGFGSFFTTNKFKDIDILLIHDNYSDCSISSAIEYKSCLKSLISFVDIVILSLSEERQLDFIRRSAALLLGVGKSLPPENLASYLNCYWDGYHPLPFSAP